MHSSTLATILKQVETNLNTSGASESEGVEAASKTAKKTSKATGGDSVEMADVCDKFIEQTKFF